jgi:hypothetical protein
MTQADTTGRRAIFLDTEVLFSDPYLRKGTFSELRAHLDHSADIDLLISTVVLDELINHQRKKLHEAFGTIRRAVSDVSELWPQYQGTFVDTPNIDASVSEYGRRLRGILKDGFGAIIVDLPKVSHAAVLERAISRRPPFDENGRGYQDTLLWLSLLELANSGRFTEIAFVSNNHRDFGSKEGSLSSSLQAELRGPRQPNILYFKTLPEAISRVFATPLPENYAVQTNGQIQRQLVASLRADILEGLQLILDEDFDPRKYTVTNLGEAFEVLGARALRVHDGKTNLSLHIRFWKSAVTKWLWQRKVDVFSDHFADVQVWVSIVLASPSGEPESVEVLEADVAELDNGTNRRRRP